MYYVNLDISEGIHRSAKLVKTFGHVGSKIIA